MIVSDNSVSSKSVVNAFICEFVSGERREVLVLAIVPGGIVDDVCFR